MRTPINNPCTPETGYVDFPVSLCADYIRRQIFKIGCQHGIEKQKTTDRVKGITLLVEKTNRIFQPTFYRLSVRLSPF